MKPSKFYNRNVVKLGLYMGYGDRGRDKLALLKEFAKKHELSVSEMILDALKRRFPDIGL